MTYMDKSIKKIHDSLIKGEVTSDELVKESLKKSHEVQEECNAFVTILDDAKGREVTDNLLSGIPYGVKDNYSTKGILSTGSSNTLRDYVPFFTATAIENLNSAGAVAVNKTVLDEFGMGGTGTTGHTGIVRNPWDHTRMCAGSSAGSAAAVASGVYPYATGSDTGDSIRKPAAYCGIVGYKPTYGMISRYGLFPFASSLDHCGVLSRSVEDAAIVVDNMKGIDPKDMTSWDSSNINLSQALTGKVEGKKLCYIKEICDIDNYPKANDELKEHLNNFKEKIELCKKLGIKVDEVSIDKTLLNAIASTYVVISCAEATSNNANLDGVKFGPRYEGNTYQEVMIKARTKGFSELIRRRFIIGSFALMRENQNDLFLRAQKARRLIVNRVNEILSDHDIIYVPAAPTTAPKINASSDRLSDNYLIADNILVLGNFEGLPSITLPIALINNMPLGGNLMGRAFEEKLVFNVAKVLENEMGLYNLSARKVK